MMPPPGAADTDNVAEGVGSKKDLRQHRDDTM